jgi:3-methyladenine DNA glycosylase AlkD
MVSAVNIGFILSRVPGASNKSACVRRCGRETIRANTAMTAAQIQIRLQQLGSPGETKVFQRFFKTGPGEYGFGDRFLGIRVPVLRRLARELRGLSLSEAAALLRSPWHEARALALMILVDAYDRATEAVRDGIYALYLAQLDRINNWDLVDISAPGIVGRHLAARLRKILFRLARSKHLWHRRVAMLATFHFIRAGDFADALRLAEALRDDEHDLVHKAVGWMLREIGKRDVAVLRGFLDGHAAKMPRTMLRYAIEKLPERERQRYLRAGKS